MTTVLAAIDTSACAKPVLDTASRVAALFDATPRALHVRQDGSEQPGRLARAAAIELREVAGQPVPAIIEAAAHPDVAALVLGARGVHGGPQPAGSTALEVITRVAKPVVVVPPHAQPTRPFGRILVPLEGTADSSQALAETVKLATRADLEIVALHVHTPATVPAFSDQTHHETRAWEREFISRFAHTARDAATLIRRLGSAADDVVTVAHETEADLIALAWSQDLSPGHARVVRHTLARSAIPVLLVPVP
jgi:nucleotide-binding universal stress UspA family protein